MKKILSFLFVCLLFSGVLFAQNADFNLTNGIQIDALVPHFEENSVMTTASWSSLLASPHAVSRSCCAYIKRNDTGFVYQFGGGSGAQYTNVAMYNTRTNTWTNSVTVIPANMSAAFALGYKDTAIYVIGGESVGGLGKILRYSVNTNTWTTLTNMTSSPCTDEYCCLYKDSLIYAIGGGDGLFGTNVFANVRVYSIRLNTWSDGTPLPAATSMMTGGLVGDTIIVTSGWTGSTGTAVTRKGVINPATPTTITWSTVADCPNGANTRSASFVVSKNGQGIGVVVTCGALNGATYSGATSLWNFCTQSWQTLTANSTPRSNLRGTGGGDSLFYLISGYNGAGIGNCDLMTFSAIDGTCAGLVGINTNGNGIPTGYQLAQNYPNPFNPSTQISFGMPNSGNVKIVVTDILGREVSVVFDGFKTAGVHTMQFDAANLASGIYFYSMITDNYKETRKMLLIK